MNIILPSIFGLLLPITPYFGHMITGSYVLLPLIMFVLLVPMELSLSMRKESDGHGKDISYGEGVALRFIERLHLVSFLFGFIAIFSLIPFEDSVNQILLVANLCIISAIASSHMHESSHSLIRMDEFFCKAYMVFTGYGHFKREQEYHHYDQGTTEIGGVNLPGENVYGYVKRQIPVGLKYACTLEEKLLLDMNKSHLHNSIFWNFFSTTFLAFLLMEFFGEIVLVAFVVQMLTTICLNYMMQYVQHYGLTFKRSSGGDHGLAWEHDKVVENMVFTNCGHHAKHHKNRFLPQFLVRKTKVSAPMLPFNYTSMMCLSLAPWMWFGVMDKKLGEWLKDGGDAHLHVGSAT
jgi:hypothetical protein